MEIFRAIIEDHHAIRLHLFFQGGDLCFEDFVFRLGIFFCVCVM